MEKVILQGLGGCPIQLESLEISAEAAQEILTTSDANYVPYGVWDDGACPNISFNCLTAEARREISEAIEFAPATSRTYERYIWY